LSVTQAPNELSRLKLGTYTPQLPAEKSFSNQTNTPNEMYRSMPSKSFIRKQLVGQSASRGASRDLESKTSSTLYVSSARAKQEQLSNNTENKTNLDNNTNSNLNEFQFSSEVLNQNIDLENLAISKEMSF
jgi:hypothetical protein